jgi:uncharacterized membrane protein
MRLTGRLLFALGLAVTGALTIVTRDFGLVWRPLAEGNRWHDTFAILAGALLFATAIALLVARTAQVAALVLAVFLLLRELVLQLPVVVARPLVEASWYSVSENLILLAGAWTIFSLLPREKGALTRFRHVRTGQILFALALPAIGLSHMFYLDQTAPLIPPWLPLHVPLAYLTGAAHIAAGAAILFDVLPRIAATLEAVMVSLFTLLVWVPMVSAHLTNRFDWSEICVSTAIAGAAWAVAESFRDRAWRFEQRGRNLPKTI